MYNYDNCKFSDISKHAYLRIEDIDYLKTMHLKKNRNNLRSLNNKAITENGHQEVSIRYPSDRNIDLVNQFSKPLKLQIQ